MDIIIGLFAGLAATMIMDLGAIFSIRFRLFDLKGLQIVPSLLGRWLINAYKTKEFKVNDITRLSPQKTERPIGMMAHYLIGLFLGIIFVLVSNYFEGLSLNIITGGIFYGLLTNIFPWLIIYPAMGFGVFCRKLSICKQILLFSFLNHFIYGLFLGVTANLLFN